MLMISMVLLRIIKNKWCELFAENHILSFMKVMILESLDRPYKESKTLVLTTLPDPLPGPGEVLLKVVHVGCAIQNWMRSKDGLLPLNCRWSRDTRWWEWWKWEKEARFQAGDRLGVAWIFSSCGTCSYCLEGNENLCPDFRATGRDVNGGYAEYMVVPDKSAFRVPDFFTDAEAAPLLCAGAIGYRSLKLTGMRDGKAWDSPDLVHRPIWF